MLWLQAMKIGRSLRTQFQKDNSELAPCDAVGTDALFWSKAVNGNLKKTSLLLLHQEVQAGNVGLQGHGFFTCSYGFIATVSHAQLTDIAVPLVHYNFSLLTSLRRFLG